MKREDFTGADTGNTSADPPQPLAEPARNKGGAPFGNRNAAKHLAYSKRKAEEQRDRHVRASQRAVSDILAEHGLNKSATWRAWGSEVVTLMTVRGRILAYAVRRGFFDKSGNMRPSVKDALDRCETLLVEFRKLIEANPRAPVTGDVVYRVILEDPEVVGTAASASALAGLALADETMADGPIAPTPSARITRGVDRPAHESLPREQAPPDDLRELVQEPEAQKMPDGARNNGEPAPHPGGCLCAKCRWDRYEFADED